MENNQNQVLMVRSIDNFITMPPRTDYANKSSIKGHSHQKPAKDKKCMVEPFNFDFSPQQKHPTKTIDIARIHSKLTTKRVGGQVVLVARK